jgi:hypothetical protein
MVLAHVNIVQARAWLRAHVNSLVQGSLSPGLTRHRVYSATGVIGFRGNSRMGTRIAPRVVKCLPSTQKVLMNPTPISGRYVPVPVTILEQDPESKRIPRFLYRCRAKREPL